MRSVVGAGGGASEAILLTSSGAAGLLPFISCDVGLGGRRKSRSCCVVWARRQRRNVEAHPRCGGGCLHEFLQLRARSCASRRSRGTDTSGPRAEHPSPGGSAVPPNRRLIGKTRSRREDFGPEGGRRDGEELEELLGEAPKRVGAVGFEADGVKNDRHDRGAAFDIFRGGNCVGLRGRRRVETDDDAVKEAAPPLLEDSGKIPFMQRVKERRRGGEAEYRRDLEARVVRRERGAKKAE